MSVRVSHCIMFPTVYICTSLCLYMYLTMSIHVLHHVYTSTSLCTCTLLCLYMYLTLCMYLSMYMNKWTKYPWQILSTGMVYFHWFLSLTFLYPEFGFFFYSRSVSCCCSWLYCRSLLFKFWYQNTVQILIIHFLLELSFKLLSNTFILIF